MYHYFCNDCGHHFASDLPERDANGLLNDIDCPKCGCWEIYPDNPAGSDQAVKALTDYENAVEVDA